MTLTEYEALTFRRKHRYRELLDAQQAQEKRDIENAKTSNKKGKGR